MSKKYISRKEYARVRDNYLRAIRRYKAQGLEIEYESFIPSIPKKPTEGSIRRIHQLQRKLKEVASEKRPSKSLKISLKKAKTFKKKNPKAVHTFLPKEKMGVPSTPPSLLDETLQLFEQEFASASVFSTGKSLEYNRAVQDAGQEADNRLSMELNKLYYKYMPDITKPAIRVEVSLRLNSNFTNLWSGIEAWLYEFVSDGQGGLTHTDYAIQSFIRFLEVVSGTSVSLDEKKRIAELQNQTVNGSVVKGNMSGELIE